MVSLSIIKDMVMVSCFTIIIGYIKVVGSVIINMEEDIKNLLTNQRIKGSIKMENQTEQENIAGKMDKDIKDNGLTDSNVDQVCGQEQREIAILVSGEMAKLMALVYIHGLMEIDIKGSLLIV